MFKPPGSYYGFDEGPISTNHLNLAVASGMQLQDGMERLDLTAQEAQGRQDARRVGREAGPPRRGEPAQGL